LLLAKISGDEDGGKSESKDDDCSVNLNRSNGFRVYD